MAKVLIEVSDEMYLACVNNDEINQDRVILAEAIRNGKRICDPRPLLVLEHGEAYLEPRYMDAMLAFETRLKMAETLGKIFVNFDGSKKYDADNMTVRDLEKAFPDIDVPRYDGDKNIILMWRDKEANNG